MLTARRPICRTRQLGMLSQYDEKTLPLKFNFFWKSVRQSLDCLSTVAWTQEFCEKIGFDHTLYGFYSILI